MLAIGALVALGGMLLWTTAVHASPRAAAQLLPPDVAVYAEVPLPYVAPVLVWPTESGDVEINEAQLAAAAKRIARASGGRRQPRLAIAADEQLERMVVLAYCPALDDKLAPLAKQMSQMISHLARRAPRARHGDDSGAERTDSTLTGGDTSDGDDASGSSDASTNVTGKDRARKRNKHAGVRLFKLGEARAARFGPWLAVSNDRELLIAAIDRYRAQATAAHANDATAPPLATLADDPHFAAAAQESPTEARAWVFARRAVLQRCMARGAEWPWPAGLALVDRWRAMTDELIASTPFVAAAVIGDGQRAAIEFTVAHDAQRPPALVRLLTGLEQLGPARSPVVPPGTILSLSMHLNEDLLELATQTVVEMGLPERIGRGEPELETAIAGLGVSQRLLGQIRPEVQLVVARPAEWAADAPEPDLRLPALALIFEPRQPREARTRFLLSYLGAMNAASEEARQAGRPRLRMESRSEGPIFWAAATFQQPSGSTERYRGDVRFNLSPSIATVGDRYVTSSSKSLCLALAQMLAEEGAPRTIDRSLRIDVGPAAAALLLGDIAAPLLKGQARGEPVSTELAELPELVPADLAGSRLANLLSGILGSGIEWASGPLEAIDETLELPLPGARLPGERPLEIRVRAVTLPGD